jgi:hypothetical protein
LRIGNGRIDQPEQAAALQVRRDDGAQLLRQRLFCGKRDDGNRNLVGPAADDFNGERAGVPGCRQYKRQHQSES